MEEEWCIISEFPNYAISNYGIVVNESTGRSLKICETRNGNTRIGLMSEGKQYNRSVAVLVADAFVDGRSSSFDGVIHMDGDRYNNRADNLAWRPMWFVFEYMDQFNYISENDKLGPIMEINTGDMYTSVYTVGTTHGILFKEVRNSIILKQRAYPTFLEFEWAFN